MTQKGEAGRSAFYLFGCLLLAGVGSWTLLSFSFIYGEGHADRPIEEYLAAYGIAWISFASSVWLIFQGRRPSLRWILFVALGARLLLLPSELIQENDVYRYVLDGQVLRHGGNPYEHAPLAYPETAAGSLARSLEGKEARQVLSRIGYPHIPTVYPPAAQVFFALGAEIGGWNWKGQRLAFLAVDLSVLCLLLLLLKEWSQPRERILLYAWNPLILKEVVNSAHLDILVPLFLLSVLWMLFQHEKGGRNRLWIASLLMGLAVLSKLYPLLLLPAFLTYLVRREGWTTAALCGVAAGLVTLAGYLPFLGIGWTKLTAGLTTYAEQWRMNDGAFALFRLWTEHPRWVSSILIAVLASSLPLAAGARGGVRRAAEIWFWVLLGWFLLMPTPFPWYATGLLALSPLLVVPAAWMAVSVSGSTAIYYLSFVYEYHHMSDSWWAWARGIEHGLLWTCLAVTVCWRLRQRRPEGDR